jgi:hypothetical protein
MPLLMMGSGRIANDGRCITMKSLTTITTYVKWVTRQHRTKGQSKRCNPIKLYTTNLVAFPTMAIGLK